MLSEDDLMYYLTTNNMVTVDDTADNSLIRVSESLTAIEESIATTNGGRCVLPSLSRENGLLHASWVCYALCRIYPYEECQEYHAQEHIRCMLRCGWFLVCRVCLCLWRFRCIQDYLHR